MYRFAASLMFIACLLYSAMPALALPAGKTDAVHAAHVQGHDTSKGADHDGHMQHAAQAGMAGMTAMPGMDHSTDSTKTTCPHGGKSCITPFCAACPTLLPEMASEALQAVGFAYPRPSPAADMTPHRPGLTDPPPRA